MNRIKLDKTLCKLGPVVNFCQTTDGYGLTMFHRDVAVEYACTKTVYDYLEQGRYGCYPNVMELIYVPICDHTGAVVQLIQADSFLNMEHALITTTFSIATAMATKPATAETIAVGNFFQFEGNVLRLSPEFSNLSEHLVYTEHTGAVGKPEDSLAIPIAEDITVYTWDWSKPKEPIERSGIPAKDYVPGHELGSIDDVNRCFWIWFGSLRGDDSKLDTVCCFVGQPAGAKPQE